MSTDMHPETAAAIRAELAAIGTRHSGLQRRQRRSRLVASVAGIAAVAVTTSAAALVAAGLPGTTTTAATGATTTVTRTGPALVDIGRAPDSADAVVVEIRCRNHIGMVTVPTVGDGGSGRSCREGGSLRVVDGRLPAAGTTTVSIEASPGTRWTASLRYASAVTSEWGVNAHGETYGVENATGHPDLVPGRTDDGRRGWVRWDEAAVADDVDVYETDGVTVIGRSTATVAPEVPLDQGLVDELRSVRTATPTPGVTR